MFYPFDADQCVVIKSSSICMVATISIDFTAISEECIRLTGFGLTIETLSVMIIQS